MSEIKSFVEGLSGQAVLVFGLGRSGLATIKVLKSAGVHVVVGDDQEDNLEKARALGAELLETCTRPFSDYAFVVLSPGIPFTHPQPHRIVEQAQFEGVEVICDVELFHRIYPSRKTIGVTGTNGKSTTTTLIQHILNHSGQRAVLGGNIGTAVFDLDVSDEDAWVVLEISSFQMDLCPTFRPDIAVVLNVTPDHLDRHGSMERYVAVKSRLVEPASRGSAYNRAVICHDDSYTRKICNDVRGRDVTEVSTLEALSSGVYVDEPLLYDGLDDAPVQVGDLSEIPALTGIHNYQNAACAYAVLRSLGLARADIWAGMQNFPGLNHRQYLVRTINGVAYVNDSKATNAASSAVALGCRQNIYWIVGGRQKKGGLDGLEEFFPRIKHAFLIGESTDDFAAWFDKYSLDYTRCYTLDKALDAAHEMAQDNRSQPGGAGVVLLSPACASFDQFPSFEARGDYFAGLVEKIEA